MKKAAIFLAKALLCIAVPALFCLAGYYLTRVTAEPVGRLVRYTVNRFTEQQEHNRMTDDMNAAVERAVGDIETGLNQRSASSDTASEG